MPLRLGPLRVSAATAAIVATLAVTAACYPLARAVDADVDRTRPMYHDLEVMMWLQYQSIATTGAAEDLQLDGGDSATIGEATFTASEGVSVVVRTSADDQTCVSASTDAGESTGWECIDLEAPPLEPGGTDDLVM